MTYGYTHLCSGDYRNEGWSVNGGVSHLWECWNNDDDSKYASCPSYRGRATVTFPIDLSASSIPTGAVITSVSVWIRVKKTLSDIKSVTVNLMSKDDTSRYTSRTIYPSTTVANYEVGTYTVDPLGKAWTKERLNRMMAQVFSYLVPPNDGVRVYKLWAVINYKTAPTVAVTAPSGTVTSASPTISWVYSQSEGDFQKSAAYKIFTAAQQGLTTFNPDTTTPVYSNTVSGDIQSFTLPSTLSPDDYYIYVRVQSAFGAWSAWTGRSFSVHGATPGAPGGASFGGIGTGGGGGFESVISDDTTGNAYLVLRDGSNLLGVQQADMETLTDSLGYTGVNCTLSQDTTVAFDVGSGSLKMVASSTSDMTANSSLIEVAQGTAITARAQFIAATNSKNTTVAIAFYDDQFNLLPGVSISANGTDTTGSWTETVCTGTTPTTTATSVLYAQVQLTVASPSAGGQHNVDRIGLMYGTNSAWSYGGHASRNLLTDAASTADDPTILGEEWSAQDDASTYSRVAAIGTGSEGLKMFKASYIGLSPSITCVAAGATYSTSTTGSGFTLNKPAGVADGDLLVAYVASDTDIVSTPPSGWIKVTALDTNGGQGGLSTAMTVLMRDGLASDPSTWVGNVDTTSGSRRSAVVVAYRGAAATATQLVKQGIVGSTSSTTNIRTPVLNNTFSNAYRLTAFAFRDDVSGGSVVANPNLPATVPPIAYVGKGANWWYGGAQGQFTINKPANLQTGDLMIAFGGFSGTATPTAPTGWTQVDRVVATVGNGDDHSGTGTFVVWKRTAGASEPDSWTSSYTGTGTPLMVQSVAYRNVDVDSAQFLAKGTSKTTSAGYLNTATISNTDSRAWWVAGAMGTTPTGDSMSATSGTQRSDNTTDVGNHPDVNISVWDSNSGVSTGNHSTQFSEDNESPWCMISWIAYLKPATSVPSSGNETERADFTVGTSDGLGYQTLACYDSGAVAPTGNQSIYGIFSTGSGTSINSSVAWEGFLAPAARSTAGEVGATLVNFVDLTSVPDAVWERSDGLMSVMCSFIGSAVGTPLLKLYFYEGNELIATKVAEGNTFGTSVWTTSSAQFTIPDGTTRVKLGVAAGDRSIGDFIGFDRVLIGFGDVETWRRGTGRSTHPIFNVPVIEYADDLGSGYGPWAVLPGSESALLQYDPLTGLVSYTDQTLLPAGHRKYRAKTLSYGLGGEVFASGYGAESPEITVDANSWWLKDPTDPSAAMQLTVSMEVLTANHQDTAMAVTRTNAAAVYQPLGASKPIVLSDGYKGDTFTISVQTKGALEYQKLRDLLSSASNRTLFLQTNLDAAWWVRPVGDLPAETQKTVDLFSNSLRLVDVTFVEVDSV